MYPLQALIGAPPMQRLCAAPPIVPQPSPLASFFIGPSTGPKEAGCCNTKTPGSDTAEISSIRVHENTKLKMHIVVAEEVSIVCLANQSRLIVF